MPDVIYVIKSIWMSPLENRVNDAVGYNDIGYVYDESIAKFICARGAICTKEDCWAIFGEKPQFIYQRLELFNQTIDEMKKENKEDIATVPSCL